MGRTGLKDLCLVIWDPPAQREGGSDEIGGWEWVENCGVGEERKRQWREELQGVEGGSSLFFVVSFPDIGLGSLNQFTLGLLVYVMNMFMQFVIAWCPRARVGLCI